MSLILRFNIGSSDFVKNGQDPDDHQNMIETKVRATAIDSQFSVSGRMDSAARRRKREPPKGEPKGLKEKVGIFAPKARTILRYILQNAALRMFRIEF